MDKYCTIMTTYSDEKIGKKIIESLLDKRLVACIQRQEVNSFYHWDGKVNNDKEYLLYIKTTISLYKEIEQVITQHHDYDTPEIIMLPITDGYPPYLQWISNTVSK